MLRYSLDQWSCKFPQTHVHGKPRLTISKGNVAGKGVCCNEMDIWEANSRSTQIAPHTCSKNSLFGCTGDECKSAGLCDKIGCTDNAYKHRASPDYYGVGLKVDTSKPFTVVTQFPAKNGVLQAIVRKYVQNGVVIEQPMKNITMDQAYCSAQGGAEQFNKLGGIAGMGGALSRGMVLAMSIWWDESGGMQWLDSGAAGPCNATEGFPSSIQQIQKAPTVTFSQIKWGECSILSTKYDYHADVNFPLQARLDRLLRRRPNLEVLYLLHLPPSQALFLLPSRALLLHRNQAMAQATPGTASRHKNKESK